MTHIYVCKLTIIVSNNGFLPYRRQAIIWTNAGILLIRTLGTNFSETLGEIHSCSFSKMHLEMSSAKWRIFGLGLNELEMPPFYVITRQGWDYIVYVWWAFVISNGATPYTKGSCCSNYQSSEACLSTFCQSVSVFLGPNGQNALRTRWNAAHAAEDIFKHFCEW